MTEIEGASLFLEYLNTSIQLVLGYVSILSAFLVMSYFAADKLNKWLMFVVLTLFSLVCFMLIMQITLIRNEMAFLYAAILETQASGSLNLVFFGDNPRWSVQALSILHALVTFGGYIGCLGFFFYQRTQKLSEVGT